MKLEGRRIYMRIFPVRKFAQTNYTITANLMVVHGLLENEILMCLIPRDGNGQMSIPIIKKLFNFPTKKACKNQEHVAKTP
ncbi:unnamed protein product [Prunus armeniaca]